jgi:NAD(P)-dependent dehydrogenase (short-subunit alcohol dehydrogenase family)
MKLKDKIAVVTGASRGIGRAVARIYAQEGAHVIAVARNSLLLDSLLAEIAGDGGTAMRLAADVRSDSDCRDVIERVIAVHGRIDILVNDAGLLGTRTEMTSIDSDEWRMVFDTNVAGTFMLSKYAALSMTKRSSGSIINVTSGVVRHPSPKWGAYLPSKFAVEGLTLMLAEELKNSGVRVNMIDPGRTNTDMIEAAFPDTPRTSFKLPDDAVAPFVFLASDESKLVTGTRIVIR